jgi:SanA protein
MLLEKIRTVHWKKIFIFFLIIGILLTASCVLIGRYIKTSAKPYIFYSADNIPSRYVGMVLGAHVGNDGTPSLVLADRLNTALILYQKGKIKKFLVSGDHGRKNYDEVNNMKNYLKDHGVPERDIFLDHAGFDTYNSMVRAREIFQVKDMIVITQKFHLSRALYIARHKGIDAVGCDAGMTDETPLRALEFRESLAYLKAYWEVLINKSPKFLGPKIPITGDSQLSYD